MDIPPFSSVCRGRMQRKKPDPNATHTHFCYVTVEDDPLLGAKKIETAEIFVWKQKICSESQCVLLVSFVSLPPHILVDSLSSPFLSTSKACPPPHFMTHSYTYVYELFNFKIVSQKWFMCALYCIHRFSFKKRNSSLCYLLHFYFIFFCKYYVDYVGTYLF